MLQTKEYLLQECENVRDLLRNTLRYAYSAKSSEQVYAECNNRLELVESQLKSKAIDRDEQLQELQDQLSRVGKLIGRVERSHIEEFAWPFAQALQDLAKDVCGEPSASAPPNDCGDGDEKSLPLFFFSADDELSSYSVITEQTEVGFIDQPLFNIIFPRSLKHFVLLHPILAHEVGHAAWEVHTASLRQQVIDTLTAGSPVLDKKLLRQWIERTGQKLESELVAEAVKNWPEELYCDLFGLLMMGPSFVGATCSLLQPFDVKSVSDSHPPSLTRYVVLSQAVETLGWRRFASSSRSKLKQPMTKYFGCLSRLSKSVPSAFHLLKPEQVRKATTKLAAFLRPMGNALYAMPDEKSLALMVDRLVAATPPVASSVSSISDVRNDEVDIRTILFAGWLAWHSKKRTNPNLDFLRLNLLCDRGVLQQTAVDYWNDNKAAWKAPDART